MTAPRRRPALVLMINDQEWSTRSLESILAPNGFAILRAYTGRKGLDRARTARPDMIVIDLNLPDMDGLELCQTLRDDPETSSTTPIIITTAGHPTRQQRLAALRAGAWEFLGHPMDAEEILLRFDRYTQAKLDADRAQDEGLLDQTTGLYNMQGLARRARELGSQAFREHTALACVVIGPDVPDTADAATDDSDLEAAIVRLAEALKQTGRVSDAIGRVGRAEFAVFAPGADEQGVRRLAQRVAEALKQNGDATPIRAGFEAVGDFREASIEPVDLLVRASSALRHIKRASAEHPETQEWLSRFEARLSPS